MKYIVELPEAEGPGFASEMEQRGYYVVLETEQNVEVPQWQIDEVRRIKALKDQPEPRLWDDIEAEYVRKDR